MRWGILGAATIAKEKMLPAIQKAGGQIYAIASKSRKMDDLKDTYHIPFTLHDYEQLLKVKEIDAVYIPLPNSEHFHWVLKAIEYGKHVLVEKPIVLSKSELEQIKDLALRKKVVVMEAFMYRFHPQIEEAKRLLQEGVIGDIITIRSQFHFELLDWDQDIRIQHSLGGGVLRDIGCYCINIQQLLLEQKVVNIHVMEGRKKHLDVHLSSQLEYENGSLGLIDCSFLGGFSQNLDIVGTKGTMRLPYAFRSDLNNNIGVIEICIGQDVKQIYLEGDSYYLQIEHFHQVLLGEKQSAYSWEEMLNQTDMLEQIQNKL